MLCFLFIFLLSIFTKFTIIIIIIIIIIIYILFYFISSFHLLNIFYRVITIFHVPGCFLNFLECSVFVCVIA